MSRAHDVTISAFDLDKMESEIKDLEARLLRVNDDNFNLANQLSDAEAEKNFWKAKFYDLDRSLKSELRDPNGTIWECAAQLQKERDEAKEELDRTKQTLKDHAKTADAFYAPVVRRAEKAEALLKQIQAFVKALNPEI